MNKLFILLIILLCSSCATRSTALNKQNYLSIDKGKIERSSPGDEITLPIPKTPKDRPKDTTEIYKGEHGAKAIISYDREGFLSSGNIFCPEIKELEEKNAKLNFELKEKASIREFNKEALKEIKSIIIWCFIIYSITRLIRDIIYRI